MNKLGKYARNGLRNTFKPLSLSILALTLSYNVMTNNNAEKPLNLTPLPTIEANDLMNYIQPDTLWGTGGFRTRTENNSPLGNVNLSVTPIFMETIIPDITYELITNGAGEVSFILPTYIDTITNITESTKTTETKFTVFPNPGNDLNVFFSENYNNDKMKSIDLYNMTGQLVMSKAFSKDKVYLDVEELPVAPYTFIITDGSNPPITGKYVKMDVASKGPASESNSLPPKVNFKNTTFQDYATYEVKYSKEGWVTDSVNIDIYTGENGNFFFYLEEPEPITATQDIAGFVQNGNSNTPLERIANAAVVLEHLNTGDFYLEYTQADGTFIFNDMPVQMHYLDPKQEFLFHVGGIENKYAFKNVEYSTPLHNENTWTASDTINDQFNVILMDKDENTSAQHVFDQNGYGFLLDSVEFYVGNSFETPAKKESVRKFIHDYSDLEPGSYTFVEKFTEVTYGGFNIEEGTYNTNPNELSVITPIGDTLKPTYFADITMGVGDSISAYHEIKQALGFRPCAWVATPTIMEANPSTYTIEDNAIAQNISNPYWKYVYQDSATWIPLTNIAEDIDDKIQQALEQSPNKNKQEPVKVNGYNSGSAL